MDSDNTLWLGNKSLFYILFLPFRNLFGYGTGTLISIAFVYYMQYYQAQIISLSQLLVQFASIIYLLQQGLLMLFLLGLLGICLGYLLSLSEYEVSQRFGFTGVSELTFVEKVLGRKPIVTPQRNKCTLLYRIMSYIVDKFWRLSLFYKSRFITTLFIYTLGYKLNHFKRNETSCLFCLMLVTLYVNI